MSEANGVPVVNGKYLMYKDRPLVRQGDTICYGDMTEKYILIMEIMKYKEDNGERLPSQVFVQVVESQNQSKSLPGAEGCYDSLYTAFNYGLGWLEGALASEEE